LTHLNKKLHHYFDEALKLSGDKIYIKSSTSQLSYNQFYELASAFEKILLNEKIRQGDRVVIYSKKNAQSIAMMIACSRTGAIYVPLSANNPGQRAAYVVIDTKARIILCDNNAGIELQNASLELNLLFSDSKINLFSTTYDELIYTNANNAAFILFTSGSTGTPKGVVVSHSAATAFIEWSASEFAIDENDILASIAPFNFDLSVFDIYVSARQRSTLVIYEESEVANVLLTAQRISADQITTIYATPAFYSALAMYGKLDKYKYDSLKNVLFAGEVFHMESFNLLYNIWSSKKYVNLYGPTETNVCAYFIVDNNNRNYTEFPLGKACNYSRIIILDENNNEISGLNNKGELVVSGDSVFNGYWNDMERSDNAFYIDEKNIKYYRTGDIAYLNDNNDFVYSGRKDRMIKKKGFRIEPLEIEKALIKYPGISNVFVFYSKSQEQLIGCVECEKKEIIYSEVTGFLRRFLPQYMIPDKLIFLEAIPKTINGKIDSQALINLYE
jgi:amino acid adenylation domain-containing protein